MLDFLYLNEEDMIASGVKNMEKCMNSMEEMFTLVRRKDYRMGGKSSNEHGLTISFPKETEVEGMPTDKPDYRFTAMPAYLGGKFHIIGFKVYGSNIENMKRNLPRSILMLSLLDADSGVPKAYMSANLLSAMRTGAVAGLGAKHLCRTNPTTVGIVGPGNMAQYAMRAFVLAHPTITAVQIKGRGQTKIDDFISFCKREFPQIKSYTICDSNKCACTGADIIYFSATRADRFEDTTKFEYKWLKKGVTVITASPTLADTETFTAPDVRFAVDNYEMYSGCGDSQPLPTQKNVWASLGMGIYDAVREGKVQREDVTDIGEVICGEKQCRLNNEQIVIYAIGGMAIEDVAWGYECYLMALKNNIGNRLKLWDR